MKHRQRILIGLTAALLASSCTVRRFATIDKEGDEYTLLMVERTTNLFQTNGIDGAWRIWQGAYDASSNTLRLEEVVTTVED